MSLPQLHTRFRGPPALKRHFLDDSSTSQRQASGANQFEGTALKPQNQKVFQLRFESDTCSMGGDRLAGTRHSRASAKGRSTSSSLAKAVAGAANRVSCGLRLLHLRQRTFAAPPVAGPNGRLVTVSACTNAGDDRQQPLHCRRLGWRGKDVAIGQFPAPMRKLNQIPLQMT